MVRITAVDVFNNPVTDLSFAPNELPIIYNIYSNCYKKKTNLRTKCSFLKKKMSHKVI